MQSHLKKWFPDKTKSEWRYDTRNSKDCPDPKVRRVAASGSLEKGAPRGTGQRYPPDCGDSAPQLGASLTLPTPPWVPELHPCSAARGMQIAGHWGGLESPGKARLRAQNGQAFHERFLDTCCRMKLPQRQEA